jgi:hypothetical protein
VKRIEHSAVSVLAAAAATWPLFASIAHACPMCFNGNGNNQSAFLYGSLFLMIVPVTAIGSLLYWAYKRYKAADLPLVPPAVPTASHPAHEGEPQPAPALRLIGR